MDAATSPTSSSGAPSSVNGPGLTSWTRSAQLALAFLLGVALTLVVVHGYRHSPLGSHPVDLEPGPGSAYRIDLNRAGRAELLQLPGVGAHLAQRIEDYRREHGPFQTVNDLAKVHGVGPATLRRLRPWVCVLADEPAGERMTPVVLKGSPGRKGSGKKVASLTGLIDVNRASLADLQRLPGVGAKTAQRIVAERLRAPFQSVEELRRVSGIGPKKLEALRPYVTVDREPVRVVTAEK